MTDTTETVPLGDVHYLSDRRPTARVDLTKTPPKPAQNGPQAPLEGVLLPAAPATPESAEPAPEGRTAGAVPRALRAVRTVATDQRTRQTAQFVARHTLYVLGGAGVVARRAWEARTTARYERMMRTAEAAGQHEHALLWEERAAAYRAARHQRRMDLLTAPLRLAKAAAVAAAGTTVGLLTLGTVAAIAQGDISLVLAPTMAVIELVNWLMLIITVVWGPLVLAGPFAALVGLWAVGRSRGKAPLWAVPASARPAADEVVITPSVVVTALRDLGITTLRKSIQNMEDSGAGMLSPIVLAGCGVEVDVTLPSGVMTEEVQNKRRKLAENLGRHEHELFITIPPAARTVRLWIADSGALDEPIGPSPLVLDSEASADYKTGRAPWGPNLRGDSVPVSLYQRHMLITGLSNQGKTASLRALALWLALDKRVEFRIADLKGAGDWNMFNGMATTLIEGPTDDHVSDATEMLEEGVREMERRLLAPKDTPWQPLVLIVDEAQVAFMCPAVSPDNRPVDEKGKPIGALDRRPLGGTKATSRYFNAARKLHNQGRAVDVTLWQGTQDPTDQNLPKLVREGTHIRASLVVGTESQARMALGDKAIDGGAAPHKLRQGIDKGTVVVTGDGIELPPGQASTTVRTHFIDDDAAVELADRAKAVRAGIDTRTAGGDEERDPLTDIANALGDARRMRTQEVLQHLAEADAFYRDWNFVTLKSFLAGYDAEPRKSDGQMVVDGAKVAAALDSRTEESDAA